MIQVNLKSKDGPPSLSPFTRWLNPYKRYACPRVGAVEVAPYVATVRICLSKGAPTIEVLFDLLYLGNRARSVTSSNNLSDLQLHWLQTQLQTTTNDKRCLARIYCTGPAARGRRSVTVKADPCVFYPALYGWMIDDSLLEIRLPTTSSDHCT